MDCPWLRGDGTKCNLWVPVGCQYCALHAKAIDAVGTLYKDIMNFFRRKHDATT